MDNNQSTDKMYPALKAINAHEPRKHVGRRRSFINWQHAYFEVKAIAERALKTECICGPTDGCEAGSHVKSN